MEVNEVRNESQNIYFILFLQFAVVRNMYDIIYTTLHYTTMLLQAGNANVDNKLIIDSYIEQQLQTHSTYISVNKYVNTPAAKLSVAHIF